jgi:hypothetical protein
MLSLLASSIAIILHKPGSVVTMQEVFDDIRVKINISRQLNYTGVGCYSGNNASVGQQPAKLEMG